jgi:hypothetical protein
MFRQNEHWLNATLSLCSTVVTSAASIMDSLSNLKLNRDKATDTVRVKARLAQT